MKKSLNEAAIENELKNGSVFFRASGEPEEEDDRSKEALVETPISDEEILQEVRKLVKVIGKEAATHRFTRGEKQELNRLIYVYSTQGIRTSENEITRIAINYLLQDQQRHGSRSILEQILHRLNQ